MIGFIVLLFSPWTWQVGFFPLHKLSFWQVMFVDPSKVNPALQVNVLSLKNNVSFPSIIPFSSMSISLQRTTEKKEVNLRGLFASSRRWEILESLTSSMPQLTIFYSSFLFLKNIFWHLALQKEHNFLAINKFLRRTGKPSMHRCCLFWFTCLLIAFSGLELILFKAVIVLFSADKCDY